MRYSPNQYASLNSLDPHRRRSGFLLIEVVAGATLTILALGLTLSIINRSNDLRQRNQSRELLLIRSENLLEQLACLPYEELIPEKVKPLIDVVQNNSNHAAFILKVEITEQSAPLLHKKVHLQGGLNSNIVLVHLWRDFYPQVVAK